jgi:hypothetical protein
MMIPNLAKMMTCLSDHLKTRLPHWRFAFLEWEMAGDKIHSHSLVHLVRSRGGAANQGRNGTLRVQSFSWVSGYFRLVSLVKFTNIV